MAKSYHISDVLSVMTGNLLSTRKPRPMDAFYDVLSYMTDDEVYTHQLPRVCDECAPFLKECFPELAAIDVSHINEENHAEEIAKIIEKHGEMVEVPRLPTGAHKVINPIEELITKAAELNQAMSSKDDVQIH